MEKNYFEILNNINVQDKIEIDYKTGNSKLKE